MKDISLNFDLKTLPKHLKRLALKAQPYTVFAFILTMLVLYGFLTFQISQASQAEPTPDAIAQQSNTVKRLRIDKQAVEKIEQLQDQNVNVQSLFQSARDNPFQE